MQFPFNGAAASPPVLPAPRSASDEQVTGGHANGADSLREIVAAGFRSRYWIIAIFVACIALAATAALLTTRLYQATASVEVRQEAAKVLGTEADQEGQESRSDADRFLQIGRAHV